MSKIGVPWWKKYSCPKTNNRFLGGVVAVFAVTNSSRLSPTHFLFSDNFWVKFETLQRPGSFKGPWKAGEEVADEVEQEEEVDEGK